MPSSNKTGSTATDVSAAAADAIQTLAALVQRSVTPPREDVPTNFPACDITVPLVSSMPKGSPTKVKVLYKVRSNVFEWTVRPDGQQDAEPLGTVHLVRNKDTDTLRLSDQAGRLLLLDTLVESMGQCGAILVIDVGEDRVLTLNGAAHSKTLQTVKEIVLSRIVKQKSKDGKKAEEAKQRVKSVWRYMCLAPKCGRVFETDASCSRHTGK